MLPICQIKYSKFRGDNILVLKNKQSCLGGKSCSFFYFSLYILLKVEFDHFATKKKKEKKCLFFSVALSLSIRCWWICSTSPKIFNSICQHLYLFLLLRLDFWRNLKQKKKKKRNESVVLFGLPNAVQWEGESPSSASVWPWLLQRVSLQNIRP